jgi:cold shock CspA family protein
MQASVHSFDHTTGSGSVLLDSGRLLPFDEQVFAASGLRHLRLGQRVSVEVRPEDPETTGAHLTRLWIVGVGVGQRID